MNSQFRENKHQRLLRCIVKSFFVRKLSFKKMLRIEGSFRVFTDNQLAVKIDLNGNFRKSSRSLKKVPKVHSNRIKFNGKKQKVNVVRNEIEFSRVKEEPQIEIDADEAYQIPARKSSLLALNKISEISTNHVEKHSKEQSTEIEPNLGAESTVATTDFKTEPSIKIETVEDKLSSERFISPSLFEAENDEKMIRLFPADWRNCVQRELSLNNSEVGDDLCGCRGDWDNSMIPSKDQELCNGTGQLITSIFFRERFMPCSPYFQNRRSN